MDSTLIVGKVLKKFYAAPGMLFAATHAKKRHSFCTDDATKKRTLGYTFTYGRELWFTRRP